VHGEKRACQVGQMIAFTHFLGNRIFQRLEHITCEDAFEGVIEPFAGNAPAFRIDGKDRASSFELRAVSIGEKTFGSSAFWQGFYFLGLQCKVAQRFRQQCHLFSQYRPSVGMRRCKVD